MSAGNTKFPCSACGKQYRWKPEFAGRTAKCACGAKLVVPLQAPPTPDAAEIPLAPEPKQPATGQPVKPSSPPDGESKCPSCSAPLASNAVLCVNCGYNLKTGQKLSAVVVETSEEEDEIEDDAAEAEERA
jgi:DNA-directed RNA polymerase subunit RPC12/RpoP